MLRCVFSQVLSLIGAAAALMCYVLAWAAMVELGVRGGR